MTAIVDESRIHGLTIQGNQAARAWALKHLLEATDLPVISNWMIDAQLDLIAGVVFAEGDEGPGEQIAKVQAWATYLHGEATQSTSCGITTVRDDGRCDYGFRVHISTTFRAAIKEAA